MSPRKNAGQGKTTNDPSNKTRDGGGQYQYYTSVPCPTRRLPFSKKVFFLDLKDRQATKERQQYLVNDLINCGGAIEEFFSRDVTVVITDAPLDQLAACQAQAVNAVKTTTPANSPGTVPFSPSPSAVLNNVWSPASPAVAEDRPKPKSRAEAIIERSRQQQQASQGASTATSTVNGKQVLKQPQASSQSYQVLENAWRWGIQVWSLGKTLAWITNYKSKLGKQQQGHPPQRQSRGKDSLTPQQQTEPIQLIERNFQLPYLKFESKDFKFKPVFSEFRRFPGLSFAGKSGSSPFYSPPVQATASPAAAAAAPAEQPQLQQVPSPKKLKVSTVSNPIKYKFRRIQEKEVTVKSTTSRSLRTSNIKTASPPVKLEQPSPAKSPVAAAAVPAAAAKENKDRAKEKDKKPGYCELCEHNFEKLLDHLEDERHRAKVDKADIWADLDSSLRLANQVYAGSEPSGLDSAI